MAAFITKLSLIAILMAVNLVASGADLTQPAPLSDIEWDKVQEHVHSLGKISFFPALLPVIMKNQNALELTPDQIGEEALTYSPSKMIVWTLLLIAPPLSLADTEIVDIGSQHLVLASGLKSAASEPTPVLPKNIRSDPATLKAANAEEEEDCD